MSGQRRTSSSSRQTRWAPGVRKRLMVFAVVGAIAVGYSGARYAQITDKVLDATYQVRVDLAESGGIFPGAEVTYRGVPIGRVGKVVPAGDGIRVDLKIRNRWKVPSDARAHVHNRSAVGEQYLDLVPVDEDGPYLRDGSRILRQQTSTPLPEQELLASLDRFVRSVNTDDLGTVVTELGAGFADTGDDIGRLLDGSTAFVDAARESLPATVRLLDHSATVLASQQDQASALSSFSHDLALLTDTVRTHDHDLRTLIDQGSALSRELSRLIGDVSPAFDDLVRNLVVLSRLARGTVPSFEQILVAFPWNIATTQINPRNGRAQFSLQLAQDPKACEKGYIPDSEWRPTRDTTLAPPAYGISCTDAKLNQRGSAHAP